MDSITPINPINLINTISPVKCNFCDAIEDSTIRLVECFTVDECFFCNQDYQTISKYKRMTACKNIVFSLTFSSCYECVSYFIKTPNICILCRRKQCVNKNNEHQYNDQQK